MRQGTDGIRKGSGLDAALNEVSLLSLDPRLTLTEAQELPSRESPVSSRASLHGQFPSGLRRKSLEIRLTVHLKAWKAEERGALYEKLCAWAKAGELTVSWRPGQVLQVDTAYAESLPSVSAWTKTVTVRLTAHMRPFFRDREPLFLKGTGYDMTLTFTAPGTAGAQCEFRAVNQETRELTEILLETLKGDDQLSFLYLAGLHIPAGGCLDGAYDGFGLLSLRADGESCMTARDPSSADELILLSGEEMRLHLWALRKVRLEARIYGLHA